jgi:fatty acid desaturase
MAGLSKQWYYARNYRHHVFTNVLGMDDGIGFGQRRRPHLLVRPLRNLLPAATFAYHRDTVVWLSRPVDVVADGGHTA